MKSVIVMCLIGFSFGVPHRKTQSIIPTEMGKMDELPGAEVKEHIFLSIVAGEALTPEEVRIISEPIIDSQVKEVYKKFKHLETEKLMKKGFDLETFLEELYKEALTRLGVENIVKTLLAGSPEDVEKLYKEVFSLEFYEMIFSKKFKGVDKKSITDFLNQGFLSARIDTSPVIGPEFYYRLLLDNGIAETRIGSAGPKGTSIMHGSYTIPLGRGDVAIFNWVAYENGYRVESPYLPTPPPAPPHVAKLLRIAEEQRAAGISFDE